MNIQKNYVAIKPDPLDETTAGGIFIGALPPPVHRQGTIMAIGPDCDTVKVGDKVMFMPRRGVEADGTLVVNESDDIIYIMEETA